MSVVTVEVTDAQWELERDAIARQFLQMSAQEFIEQYEAGAFDDLEPDGLMAVLGLFPELD